MSPFPVTVLLISLISHVWGPSHVGAKVFMVLMDDDAVISYKANQLGHMMGDGDVHLYKEKVTTGHDIFLESLLPVGSYTKLYSYTHLLNGFSLHTTSEEALKILKEAREVRFIQEDVKMVKHTTHTPDYLRISSEVWPELGGAESSGEGVVIGFVDTGINPFHPSFAGSEGRSGAAAAANRTKFKGKCEAGNGFPTTACGGKIVGARHFARGAIAAGDFNATRDFASPFDPDGHGSHTASTAAGNNRVPVIVNGFNYGYASGMAPGARIAVYRALYSSGGYMSDVVAAVDQAVEDGVDILSLSIGPSSVPAGTAAFLNMLDVVLLFATRAGVPVFQAVGNGGPSPGSILSFSPWIASVAASTTDRRYNNSLLLGNGMTFLGVGLSAPTAGDAHLPLAAAADVSVRNTSSIMLENCQRPWSFIRSRVRGKIVICSYTFDFEFDPGSVDDIFDTVKEIGAAGFIVTMDSVVGSDDYVRGTTVAMPIPGIILNDKRSSDALWEYYNANVVRRPSGEVASFGATARIKDGRHAVYTGQGPVVASYSSRGPDVNNMLLQTADVLKPNLLAPGSSIWAAWSPYSQGDDYLKGQDFALVSGTSMATPHVAGVAALIKQRHPDWSPAAITSAMMTTANVTGGPSGAAPILAQGPDGSGSGPATPFDRGAGTVYPARALDPGLVFDAGFYDHVRFLCAVPGVDAGSVRRAVGVGCPAAADEWCSDLNAASVTVSNLVGTRRVYRTVTNVAGERETYRVTVREPAGVKVAVSPEEFSIGVNSSRHLRIVLEAEEATSAFMFGELVLEGDRNHVVRVPLAVYVSSTLRS